MSEKEDNNDLKETSPHVLNASSNLLGICFIVMTSLKILKLSSTTFIDDIAAMATVFFMISCILSFFSIRSVTQRKNYYERVADVFFMIGLVSLFATSMMIAFDVID